MLMLVFIFLHIVVFSVDEILDRGSIYSTVWKEPTARASDLLS